MVFRGFQGGFQIRKFYKWVLAMNRFRFQYLLFFLVAAYPIRI